MATVSTGLQLYDQFSGVLGGVIRSLNMTVSAMADMQDSVDRGFNPSGVDAARAAIQQTEAALGVAADEMERLRQTMEQPIEPPPPPKWVTESVADVFQSTGLERFTQEVGSATRMVQELADAQARTITADMSFLPPNAQADVAMMNARLAQTTERLQESIVEKERLAKTLPPGALGPLNNDLERMRHRISAAIEEQQNLNAAMQRGDLSAVNKAYSRQIKLVQDMEGEIRDNTEAQERFNRSLDAGTGAAGGLLGTIKRLVAAYAVFEGAKRLGEAALGGAMEQQKMLDMFIARTGDTEIGTAMFERFKADALAAGQDVSQSLQSTLSFFSATQSVDQLTQLNKLAQRLSAFDSAGNGIEGAAFALKEALSGDIISLAERFNMSKADIRAFGIDELGKTGDIEGFLVAFDKLLEKQRMGEAAFETMMASPAKQMEIFANNMESQLADAGMAATNALRPLIVTLNQAFQAGKFDAFFNGLSTGLTYVAQILSWLVDGALWLSDTITENWSWIEPILWGIVSALGAYLLVIQVVTVALKVAAAAQAFLNAIMNLNPIILIVTLVAGLIVWLIRLWQTNDKFAAALYRVWNGILGFFDQVPIFFARVGFGVINAFQDMKVKSLEIVDLLINGVISGINWLIDKLNRIPGVSLQAIQEVDFSSRAAAEAEAIRQAGDDAIAQMEAKAATKALEREQKVLEFLDNRAAKRAEEEAKKQDKASPFDLGAWDIDSINSVDEVGRIRDTVDISAEDLRIMRELAEMRSIQNFVSLAPTVQVTHTGDINNGQDISTIVDQITDALETEIASSASAVLEV